MPVRFSHNIIADIYMYKGTKNKGTKNNRFSFVRFVDKMPELWFGLSSTYIHIIFLFTLSSIFLLYIKFINTHNPTVGKH